MASGKARKLGITLMCFLMVSSAVVLVPEPAGNAEAKVIIRDGKTYTPHAPIRINSNLDFDAAHGVTGGNGTVWAPWVIEGWEIDGTSWSDCIYIANTTDHFIIKDCDLHDATGSYNWPYFTHSGIHLYNVVNGNLTNNSAHSTDRYGISLASSNGNVVENNTIYFNNNDGIIISGSNDTVIINNNVSSNGNRGICLGASHNNSIYSNTVTSNTNSGIRLGSCNDNNIFRNTVQLHMSPTFQAIRLESSNNNNQIYHNNLINNVNNAYEVNTINMWDDGYPSGGNYWSDFIGSDTFSGPGQNIPGSDGIGDTPYVIDADTQDNYPLMNPWPYSDIYSPVIVLNSPLNNSIISAGTILDFDVFDANLSVVNYSLNVGPVIPFQPPYDLNTSTWKNESYVVTINANDTMGNKTSKWFYFTILSPPPVITLISPTNNSVIPPGTLLDFSVSDANLNVVNYSINGGPNITFPPPFDIDTSNWTDGNYIVTVNANDTAGNNASKWFNFTIDSTAPTITLVSPANNSVIVNGTLLDFSVSDANLDTVYYSFDGGLNFTFAPPYDIDTSAWLDGVYNITVFANDTAGNSASDIFVFTVDGTSPDITLNSPANNTTIRPGVPLNFTVSDAHLDSANYSVDNGTPLALAFPFDIDTTGWADGVYNVSVNAVDEVGNTASEHYAFTIDGTPPRVLWATPANGTTNLSVDTNITIQFSEPVNTSAFGLFFAINPQADNWVIHWHANNTTFYIDPILDPNTNYTVIVGGAQDFAENPMLANYTFTFSTWLDFDEDGYPDFNDTDDDNDGVPDTEDAFPKDPLEYRDTDNDGIGNNADPDDDGDGVLDYEDPSPLDPNVSHIDIDPTGGIGEFWWILVVMLLVVIVAVVALFLKLRGREEEEYEEESEEEYEYED